MLLYFYSVVVSVRKSLFIFWLEDFLSEKREGRYDEETRKGDSKIKDENSLRTHFGISSGVRVAVKQNTAHWHFRCHAKSYIKLQHC